jgi:hypothetical protein
MGFRHFGHLGGGGFFGMTLTLWSAASQPNLLSPLWQVGDGDEGNLITAK